MRTHHWGWLLLGVVACGAPSSPDAGNGGGAAGGTATAGGSTAGGSTAGGSTAGGSTAGGSTAGGSTAGGSTAGGAAGGSAGGSAASSFTIARVALASRGNQLELFVASEPGVDGGSLLSWSRRGTDGGWSAFEVRPEVTSAPLTLDVAAWDTTRFDLTFQGTCGAGSGRLCQQFWQNDLFSPVYDLGVAPDSGVAPNGPFLPSALVAPAPDRLAAYGFFFTPQGRRIARTAYTGVLPWTEYESPSTQPGFSGFFDGVGRTSAQGQETTVLVGRAATTNGLRALRFEGPTAGGGSFTPSTDLPSLPSPRTDGPPGLTKSQLSAANWVVAYDLNASGVLFRLQGDGAQAWGPWREVTPTPTSWRPQVSPSCANTSSREVCALVSSQAHEVWVVETQEQADGGLSFSFARVGSP